MSTSFQSMFESLDNELANIQKRHFHQVALLKKMQAQGDHLVHFLEQLSPKGARWGELKVERLEASFQGELKVDLGPAVDQAPRIEAIQKAIAKDAIAVFHQKEESLWAFQHPLLGILTMQVKRKIGANPFLSFTFETQWGPRVFLNEEHQVIDQRKEDVIKRSMKK